MLKNSKSILGNFSSRPCSQLTIRDARSHFKTPLPQSRGTARRLKRTKMEVEAAMFFVKVNQHIDFIRQASSNVKSNYEKRLAEVVRHENEEQEMATMDHCVELIRKDETKESEFAVEKLFKAVSALREKVARAAEDLRIHLNCRDLLKRVGEVIGQEFVVKSNPIEYNEDLRAGLFHHSVLHFYQQLERGRLTSYAQGFLAFQKQIGVDLAEQERIINKAIDVIERSLSPRSRTSRGGTRLQPGQNLLVFENLNPELLFEPYKQAILDLRNALMEPKMAMLADVHAALHNVKEDAVEKTYQNDDTKVRIAQQQHDIDEAQRKIQDIRSRREKDTMAKLREAEALVALANKRNTTFEQSELTEAQKSVLVEHFMKVLAKYSTKLQSSEQSMTADMNRVIEGIQRQFKEIDKELLRKTAAEISANLMLARRQAGPKEMSKEILAKILAEPQKSSRIIVSRGYSPKKLTQVELWESRKAADAKRRANDIKDFFRE